MRNKKSVSVIGLGKLGTPLAVTFASFGFKVIGVDTNKERIELLNLNKTCLYESGLDEILNKYKNNLILTTDFKKAILNSRITFIVVPTPSYKMGDFSLKHIFNALNQMAETLKEKNQWHLVVITSTVSPYSMEKKIKPYLEKISGKKIGKNIGLCYSPELIALGSVIKNLTHPDFILIGESDKKSGDILSKIRKSICKNNPPIIRTNFINAEIIKIALNSYITTKISFANMIARVCEKTLGADTDVVTSTLGLDSRIGPKYLTGALGFGGPCFPRDNLAFNQFIKSLSLNIKLPYIVHQFNQDQIKSLIEIIFKYADRETIVGILGLSYKPNTNVIDESQGVKLAEKLADKGFKVIAYDPVVMDNAKLFLGNKIKFACSMLDCLKQSDIIVITTPLPEFKNIKISALQRQGNPRVVIDCWRILKYQGEENVKYIALGRYIDQ